MLFTKTQRFFSSIPKEDVIRQLSGNHVRIHNLDFEVSAKGNSLRVIPHAEQINDITTLPITYIKVKADGNKTGVTIVSKMRRLDIGGPLLLLVFCAFLFTASLWLMYDGVQPEITFTLMGISIVTYGCLYARLYTGYFDYVRKIRDYVGKRLDERHDIE